MRNENLPSMKISHNIIEHLGLKLYQNKPTNVIAELVSNAWDANATSLKIKTLDDEQSRFISIADNGCGMDLETLKDSYLIIGKAKYNNLAEQAKIKQNTKRNPMGRKGIGKLAPFGICNEIHVITVKNNICNWLKFDYNEMIKIGKNSTVENYQPEFILYEDSLELSKIDTKYQLFTNTISDFLNDISSTQSGTLIILTNLTLKKSISTEQLIQSIGQRFTVALGRPDFKIWINETEITEENALPKWEYRIPENGTTTLDVLVNGEQKKFSYWIGFVKEATWPTEHAGIGIYAHGKIAQDRPFFFNVEGREIFSRYMYGVIEADLIEELEEDLISTDRTSINWENSAFDDFLEKGRDLTKKALDNYLRYRQNIDKEVNTKRVEQVIKEKAYNLNEIERSHLSELLNEISPKLGKDEDKIQEFTNVLAKSWLNEPSRRLVKKLWIDVEKENDLNQLQSILSKLSDELVPQSLNLTRTFAQRIFALTKLKERIEDRRETPLQHLLEDFPWILSHSYEKFTKRQSLINVIRKAEENGHVGSRNIALQQGRTMPDFVFLGTGNDDSFLVIELKENDSIGFSEFEQLRSYVEYLENTYPASEVKGILIAASIDSMSERKIKESSSLEFMTWDTLLKTSRKSYITFLTALLLVSSEDPQDAIDWGGEEVEEFLQDMAKNDIDIKNMMDKYQSKMSS